MIQFEPGFRATQLGKITETNRGKNMADLKKYRIWWSPVGHPNGDAIIFAKNEGEAKTQAHFEMTKFERIGAYGADEIKPT